jgi:hypothetical protein
MYYSKLYHNRKALQSTSQRLRMTFDLKADAGQKTVVDASNTQTSFKMHRNHAPTE